MKLRIDHTMQQPFGLLYARAWSVAQSGGVP